MVRKYFGTDGIRGRANGTITPELALKVGQAAGLMFRNGDHRHRVLIGKDTRLSGYMIETALVAGFTSVGMDVLLTGPMPTPAVAMLTRSMRADLGVMISASHNPYDDNGIKLFGPDGYKLSDEIELKIEELMDGDLSKRLAKSAALGRAKRIDGVQDRYIEFAKRTLPRNLSLDGLRIVVDCANGAAYSVAPAALWELGAEVVSIGVEPDGFNINNECGSTAPAALARQGARDPRRHRHRARRRRRPRGAVDERGHARRRRPAHGGDRRKLEGRGPPRQARRGRHRHVESRAGALSRQSQGLTLARTAVGDRYVLEEMREHGYNLGGEASGHIILSDYATTGDGLVAALQVLAVVKKLGRPASEVCHRFEPLPQIMRNVRYKTGKPLENAKVVRAIKSAEQRLERPGPAGDPPVRHRDGDPRDGRGRRQVAGRGRGRRHRRGADRRGGVRQHELFDHRVDDGKQVRRHVQSERFGGLYIDDELELCGLHHWKIGRLLTLQNAPGVNTHFTIPVHKVVPVAHKTAGFGKFA